MKISNINFLKLSPCRSKKQGESSRPLSVQRADSFERVSFGHGFISIRELSDIPCAYCGIKMIDGKEAFPKIYNLNGKKGLEVLNTIKPYYDNLLPVPREVYDEMLKVAKKFPRTSLEKIMQYKYPFHLENLKKTCGPLFEQIENLNLNFSPQSQRKFDKTINYARECLFSDYPLNTNRRYKILGQVNWLYRTCPEKEAVAKVSAIINKIPRIYESADMFIIESYKKDAKEILHSILLPSTMTRDHIAAKVKKGQSLNDGNKLYTCWNCNSSKNDKDLEKLMKVNESLPFNLQKHMNFLINELNSGKLSPKEFNPEKIKTKIFEESNHKIILDTSNYKNNL